MRSAFTRCTAFSLPPPLDVVSTRRLKLLRLNKSGTMYLLLANYATGHQWLHIPLSMANLPWHSIEEREKKETAKTNYRKSKAFQPSYSLESCSQQYRDTSSPQYPSPIFGPARWHPQPSSESILHFHYPHPQT